MGPGLATVAVSGVVLRGDCRSSAGVPLPESANDDCRARRLGETELLHKASILWGALL